MKRMKQIKACMWLLLAACILSVSMTSCDKLDGEDDSSYNTRTYLIGVGKWRADKVKTDDGSWSDNPYAQGKSFTLEFFNQYSGVSKVKIWESFGITDPNNSTKNLHEGTYVVKGTTAIASVDGKEFMRLVVTDQTGGNLKGIFTFPTLNQNFEAEMVRTW